MLHSAFDSLENNLQHLIQRLQQVMHENHLLRQQVISLQQEQLHFSEKNQILINKIKDSITHLRAEIHERI